MYALVFAGRPAGRCCFCVAGVGTCTGSMYALVYALVFAGRRAAAFAWQAWDLEHLQGGLMYALVFAGRRAGRWTFAWQAWGSKLDEIGPDDLFCYMRLRHPEASSDGFRGVSEGFQRGLKPSLFLKEGSEMCVCFVLNHMAARNWMKSVPTTCFATYGFFKAIPRRPVMVSEGFQRGLKGSVASEGFQRGLKPCGFRGGFRGF